MFESSIYFNAYNHAYVLCSSFFKRDFHDDQINKRATKRLSLSEVNDMLSREVLAEIPAQVTSYFEVPFLNPGVILKEYIPNYLILCFMDR